MIRFWHMKKLLSLLGLIPVLGLGQTCVVTWDVYAFQTYRLDVKTNLVDPWYPYCVVQMASNYVNGVFFPLHAGDHQPVHIDIPVSKQSGFFRLYTAPQNPTTGQLWPNSNSVAVPFTIQPPK